MFVTPNVRTQGPAATDPLATRRARVRGSIETTLLGGLAVALWCGVVIADRAGVTFRVDGWLFWSCSFVGGAHFAMSYRLAYHGRARALRSHPIALVVGPAMMICGLLVALATAAAGMTGAVSALRIGVAAVFGLTMWHYVKQVFGVVKLVGRFTGFELSPRESTAVRYGLYPLWFISLVQLVATQGVPVIDTFGLSGDLLATTMFGIRPVAVTVTIVTLTLAFLSAARRNARVPPAALVMPCVASLMWLGWTPNLAVTVVLLPAMHALQYLVLCERAMGGLLADRPGAPIASTAQHRQVAQILAAAGCMGLLATSFLPGVLDSFAGVPGQPGLWLLAIFVFLNLHHYLIDATVWKGRGELVQTVLAS